MTTVISVQPRSAIGKGLLELRTKGLIPGVIYGAGVETISVAVKLADLEKLFKSEDVGRLFSVAVEGGKPIPVLLKEVQRDNITSMPIHVDFHGVRADQKINAEVRLHLIGEPPAVKNLGGTLVRNLDHIKVSCLPGDLITELSVDISKLETFEDSIKVSDLTVPATLHVLDHADEVVAVVMPIKEEKAEVAPVTEAELVAQVEGVVKPEKTEGEAGEKGDKEKKK
ncbi:MAG: 50S ribosomal protein L25 [bacterium]|nr:50S ribosomal protein L25 [bacterium]